MKIEDVTGSRTPVPPPDPKQQCLDDLLAASLALAHAQLTAGEFAEIELSRLRHEIADALTIVNQSVATLTKSGARVTS